MPRVKRYFNNNMMRPKLKHPPQALSLDVVIYYHGNKKYPCPGGIVLRNASSQPKLPGHLVTSSMVEW